jgi:heat shock protein 90kDa beta
VEFRSILFVPSVKKEELMDSKTKNIRLYVKRVFISDDFDGELVKRNMSHAYLSNFIFSPYSL